MTIALVHRHKAFLPAIHGYTQFFNRRSIRCEAVTPRELASLPHQVEWHFMGIDQTPIKKDIYKIHEYLSTSTPPFQALKDLGKRLLNSRPDLRIYKNEYVQRSMGINDQVPFCYQDVGIAEEWLTPSAIQYDKEFDFIYVGELSAKRKPELLIDRFTRPDMQQHTLLLLSRHYAHLQEQYHRYPNIIFKGPVAKSEVKEYILRSRFAINYMPDIEPFNQLTSTKFLEYAACGIPIVSTDYPWVRNFSGEYGGNYLLVSPDLSELNWEHATSFPYHTPDMSGWTWEQQIRKSGVLNHLETRFPECHFQR
jgi:glycosyltransferase involved in cell wall biosynthesis